eukprot:6919499-Pyramimonas_sp.AAC.1
MEHRLAAENRQEVSCPYVRTPSAATRRSAASHGREPPGGEQARQGLPSQTERAGPRRNYQRL